jgi:serine/threonine-protein kinase
LRKALSKKPDGRYGTCAEFIDALEKACAATKGWRALPRGGSLNEPTVAEAPRPAVTLPRAIHPTRLGDTTVTSAHSGRRSGGFLTFLLAALVAGGLIALIALQSPQWLSLGKEDAKETSKDAPADTAKKETPKSESPPAASPAQPPPATATAPEAGQAPSPSSPRLEAKPDDTKPSPLGPPERKAPAEQERPSPPPARGSAAQPITIISSPGGAKAMLDSRPDAVCTTPCSVDAAPGRHTIVVTLAGYQPEHREVDVSTGPVEMPAVVLRVTGGTVMISSDPKGAAVLVNGKPTGRVTPVDLKLAPGTYTVTVELGGRQSTQTVQVGTGISLLRFTLEQ